MIYSGTIEAKTGHSIPVYTNGKPAHSKYNPLADRIQIAPDASGCAVVFGIAAGFHIKNLLQNQDILKVIAVEADKESLEYCRNFDTVKELQKDGRILLCSLEDFSASVRNTYLPSLHKKLLSVFLRSWHDAYPDADTKIGEMLTATLDLISQDFSVQAHFGKHWHRNILTNLKFIGDQDFFNGNIAIPAEKTKAAVIAAGPTLDRSMETLKNQKDKTFIISTDTAYGPLVEHGIIPDAVVSVDAQQVSSEHFLGVTKSETLFIFDIASNPETVRMVHETGNRIFFVRSNHPLAALVKDRLNIPLAESGSGTVTIAAADWARQQGFSEIEFHGADFAYSDGKPYCRGTYLEARFNCASTRVFSSEQQYSALMFRTELEKTDRGLLGNLGKCPSTSKVLASYGQTLLEWAAKYGFRQDGKLFIASESPVKAKETSGSSFDYKEFMDSYIGKVQYLADRMKDLSTSQIIDEILSSAELVSLLPLFAALGQETIMEDISIALQLLLYYNLGYENKK